MKKVDEVYPLDINSTIGPTGTIKRLFRSRDYFLKRGYEMTILANVPVSKNLLTYNYELRELTALPGDKDSGIMADTINAPGWRSQLKSKLKTYAENDKWFSSFLLNRKVKKIGEEINAYLEKERTPDIIVFHEARGCYFYLKNRKNNLAKVAIFVHADGTDDSMFLKSRPKLYGTKDHLFQIEMFNYCIHHADRIVFISDLARLRFSEAHPDCASKAITILNGIDDKEVVTVDPSTSHQFRLVSTGSVCERKGQYIVVEAMHRMKPDVLKETHFTVIGTGPDHALLMEKVTQYGLQENVTFLGNQPNSEIHRLLSMENIYILMSNNEGLPISILEAMRAGLPVISTKIAGIPETVDERNGRLIEPNIEQLTDVLNQLPDYDWNVLGKSSRKRYEEEFTFDIMRRNYADMFDSLTKLK